MIEVVMIGKESNKVLTTYEGDFAFVLSANNKGENGFAIDTSVAGEYSKEVLVAALSSSIGSIIREMGKLDTLSEMAVIKIFLNNLRGVKNDNEK